MAAAEVHIKPSKRTGILKSLAAIIDPTIAASSLPPKVARILSGLLKFCPCNLIADLITEISKNHGDLRRFSCEIYINGSKKASSFGPSHKKAEKNAAFDLIEQFINDGKI